MDDLKTGTPSVNNDKARLLDERKKSFEDNIFASHTSLITDEGWLEDNRESQLFVGNITV